MDLQDIVKEIRNYPGVTRKRVISDVIKFFPIPKDSNVISAFGEDAAVIDLGNGEDALLLAADGIMEDLMSKNAFWAGYCSVLVNVNDIAAMGGVPLGMVSIISMKEGGFQVKVLEGIREGIEKFGVPMVGGHTQPDCDYNALDVAILGRVKKEDVILSGTARPGDDIIFAMDLDGKFTPSISYSWDTTSRKSPEAVRSQIKVMNEMAEKKLLTAAKDISNPGSLGTLAMLLETSGKGGEVALGKIPLPETPEKIDLVQWLTAYQGCGFVVTCEPRNSNRVLELYDDAGITGSVAGTITDGTTLKITDGEDSRTLFDLEKDIITGCRC